jgi:hypothetical protein
MTISQQLQFSVLAAPVATLDRRTLSQAWYSALYGGGKCEAVQAKPRAGVRQTGTSPLSPSATSQSPRTAASMRRVNPQLHRGASPLDVDGTPYERRAPRSPLARKIERAFLRPRSSARKTAFTIEGQQGRIHVLLQSRGSCLKLVAICPAHARVHVAAALAQARYALSLRGIDLDADAREARQC